MALPTWTEIEAKLYAASLPAVSELELLVFDTEPAIGRAHGLQGKTVFRYRLERVLAEVAAPVEELRKANEALRKENAALEYLRGAVHDAVEHWDRTSEHKTAVLAFALDECNKRRLA